MQNVKINVQVHNKFFLIYWNNDKKLIGKYAVQNCKIKWAAMKCIYIPKSDLQKSTCTTIGKRVHAKHVAMNTKNNA